MPDRCASCGQDAEPSGHANPTFGFSIVIAPKMGFRIDFHNLAIVELHARIDRNAVFPRSDSAKARG
jgi:hypothetical protein